MYRLLSISSSFFKVLGVSSILSLIVLFPAAQPASAQADAAASLFASFNKPAVDMDKPTAILRRQVQEVSLVLSVTDHKGRFVGGLLPSDLTIFDNNKKQEKLTFFQSQTDLPLEVALVVDMSSSVAYRFRNEQSTIKKFLRKVTRPEDSIFLLAFNQKAQMVTPITDNWKQIVKEVHHIEPDGETALFDAVSLAGELLAKNARASRRLIILVTDGEENSSHKTLADATASVLKAEATIYAINVSTEVSTREETDGQTILKQLADATGGSYLRQAKMVISVQLLTKLKES